jgi:antitoxin VapB
MSGRSQHVTIPAEFRFNAKEVYIQRDPKSGTLTLSEKPPRPPIEEVFARLDEAVIPDDFLLGDDRDRRPPEDRPELTAILEADADILVRL